MKSFLKFILSIFLIIAVIGIGLQFSRVSDYKSITNDPHINNTIKANGSSWQNHEQEGLNYFIVMAVVCGIGLILLPKKKKTTSTDKEVIQPEVNQETIATIIKKEGILFKIGMSVTLVLIIVIVIGSVYRSHEASTTKTSTEAPTPTKTSTDAPTPKLYISYGGPKYDGGSSTKIYSDVKEDLYKILDNINYDNIPAFDEETLDAKYRSTGILTYSYTHNITTKNFDKDSICLNFYTDKAGLNSVIVYNRVIHKFGVINNPDVLKCLDYILFDIKYK